VVGTLSCWSRQPALFTAEDERVLEMMASQVATALAAADTYEATERDARHDALTGLANRRQLDADLPDRLAPALARGEKVAIAMLDIDHFKRFNDRFGHDVGDEALRAVAGAVSGALRGNDLTYRYGGEEFTIVLDHGSPEVVVTVLERVRAAIAAVKLRAPDGQPVGPVTVSIGLAIGPDDSTDPAVLLRLADQALLHAKRTGRNRVTRYSFAVEGVPEAA
jgi:diguanylate cyclase (GGDEF)-like protein